MAKPVVISRDAAIAIITLNRPESYNAFDRPTIQALADALARVVTDDAVEAVILTGAGKAFCAGGNLKAILGLPEGPRAGFHAMAPVFHLAITEMRRTPKPVIAAINGVAAGGGFSLALAADFRVMARSATLRCAYAAAGLCPDGGGTFTLPRLVGAAKALEIMALDETITAARALELGLITRIAEDDRVLEEAKALAGDLAGRSLHAFGWTKRLLHDAFSNTLEHHLELERQGIAACGGHPDGIEGLTAFAEKRRPRFRA
ncbi:MAG TPA: enoyl-CoA hydratase-related protein [Candidatus Hydrogenedentes bacterium]|nr:enoyl-CoA hydratase-related protein [Candidatus Hydrogenedentota bacterium]HNT87826.1 enoyl-CoA hydratase-related protein [Candidatus Hydrogenedentota bacterium]